jgi:hypothetical protein
VRNYVATEEGGFKPEEFDVIINPNAIYTNTQLNLSNLKGSSKYKNLMVQVDFMLDGSDSTIHAEKLLTA